VWLGVCVRERERERRERERERERFQRDCVKLRARVSEIVSLKECVRD